MDFKACHRYIAGKLGVGHSRRIRGGAVTDAYVRARAGAACCENHGHPAIDDKLLPFGRDGAIMRSIIRITRRRAKSWRNGREV